ncbi:GGDEF domain-containing protein [Motilimonas eburnea]|uniref:GGDEF domain-containing protein n=1 Tax=Motilimonas eburnea TaxID=1737488 RepID=UPI001E2D49DD|nr:GGDEF domain-containing protein [Motilimonas eburnea]MCE2570805.1 GGDEF domain-containing protein [Motilimonas eburnea]
MDNLSRVTSLNEPATLSIACNNGFTLSSDDKLEVMEALQQSLELKELMRNFATQAARFVQFIGIRFQSEQGFFTADFRKSSDYIENFALNTHHEHQLGYISYRCATPLDEGSLSLLDDLHRLLLLPLQHCLRMSELKAISLKDHLTGIGNRAYYEESISRSIEHCSRAEQGLALMLLDLNDFKLINDNLGHQVGDQALTAFASVLTKAIRHSDMVFRLGGDEFAIILTPTTADSATLVEQRIRKMIAADPTLADLKLSSSIGCHNWHRGLSTTELFRKADVALYKDKKRK